MSLGHGNRLVVIEIVNRCPIGTPYRRAKGTPLRSGGLVDAVRVFRAAGGAGGASAIGGLRVPVSGKDVEDHPSVEVASVAAVGDR